MKYAAIVLVCLAGLGLAEEGDAPDPQSLLNDLILANAAKDVEKIDSLLKGLTAYGQSGKDEAMLDALAKELAGSPKACKGNFGTLSKVMTALGELRSKNGAKALKKYAFVKKPKGEQQEMVQAAALVALGKYGDSKNINGIGDMCKNKSKTVAKGAYEAFRYYGTAKGKTRRRCAEILMKMLEMEYPSYSPGGKRISAEKQARWQELQPIIVESMQAITRETTINDVDNWREWWKENKKSRKAWKD